MAFTDRLHNRGSISTGYDIENSLKFESDNLETLYAVPWSSAGTRTTHTWSIWVKRTELGTRQMLLEGGTLNTVTGQLSLSFQTNDALEVRAGEFVPGSVAGTVYRLTNRVFRDTSAWYHIVAAFDTTQATANNRIKIWINGVQETSFATIANPAQNTDLGLFAANAQQTVAVSGNNGFYYNGYITHAALVYNQQLDADSFGEFDSDSGIWKPIDLENLTFGAFGFWLKFENSSSLGKDSSGNNHGFTTPNISSADQATDSPTNNGCTLNVLASLEGSNDITEGALVSTGKAGGGGNFNGTYGTIGIDPFNSTVDWYWEIETSIGTSGSDTDIGIGWIKESRITSGSTAYNNVYADGISRYSSQTANAAGDIWGVLLETGTTPVMKLYRNDGLIYTATHGSGGVSFDTLMFPYITVKGTGTDARLNFLNPASSFSIASGNTDPNGYGNFEFDTKGGYALCTKNLAEYG